MVTRAPSLRTCGCIVRAGTQCAHAKARKAASDQRRPTAQARGYTGKWAQESKAWLAQPGRELCACGCGRAAEMVDHIVAPKGDMTLFWSRSNWQPMTRACNSRKAARTEGSFGRAPAQAPGVVGTLAKGPLTDMGQQREISSNFSSPGKGQKS